jgi:hypothetical protein
MLVLLIIYKLPVNTYQIQKREEISKVDIEFLWSSYLSPFSEAGISTFYKLIKLVQVAKTSSGLSLCLSG